VLHSLDPAEVEQFERVLAESPDLRDEVTELSDTAVELGLALRPIRPDDALRARILAEVAATRQRNGLVAVDPSPVSRQAAPTGARGVRRRFPRAMAVVLGVAAALGLIFAVAHVTTPTPRTSDGPVAVGAAADARIARIPVDGGGTLTVEWSHRLGRAVVTASGLPRLAADRTYQLWYIDGEVAHPAGLLGRSGRIELDGRLAEGDTIGMTVERAGGASAPSMVPIASVAT
jgi:anti-sigma-K factor RskA